MTRYLTIFREAYDENPGLVVLIILLFFAAGCAVGYRFLGPALFG